MNAMIIVYVLIGMIYILGYHSNLVTSGVQKPFTATKASTTTVNNTESNANMANNSTTINNLTSADQPSTVHTKDNITHVDADVNSHDDKKCTIYVKNDKVSIMNCELPSLSTLHNSLGKAMLGPTEHGPHVHHGLENTNNRSTLTTSATSSIPYTSSIEIPTPLPSLATRGEPPAFVFIGNLVSTSGDKIFVKLYGRPTWPGSVKYEYYGITNDIHGLTSKIPIKIKYDKMIEDNDIIYIDFLDGYFQLYQNEETIHYNPYRY